jgi:hypothetical protein
MSFLLVCTLCRTSWASLSNASSLGSIFRYLAKASWLVLEERRRKWFVMSSSFLLIMEHLLLLLQSIAHYCYQRYFLRRSVLQHRYLARLVLRLFDTIATFVYHPCSGIIAFTRPKRGRY